jgi:hypothetical protein
MTLGQREPELFAFKNHLEMKLVAGIVPAIGVFPSRVQQAAVQDFDIIRYRAEVFRMRKDKI